jgi:hypothetical protein
VEAARGGNGNGPTIAGADDRPGGDETHERIAEALVTDVKLGAELRAAERASPAKRLEHEGVEIARRLVLAGGLARGEGEVDDGVVAGHELKAQRIGRGCGAVLDGEDEGVLVPAHVQIGVAPGVEVAASAKRPAGLRAGAAIFACMMHDEDGDVVLALQGAEVAEQRGDLSGVVLVGAPAGSLGALAVAVSPRRRLQRRASAAPRARHDLALVRPVRAAHRRRAQRAARGVSRAREGRRVEDLVVRHEEGRVRLGAT